MSTLVHKRIGLGAKIELTPRGTYRGIASKGNEPDCVGDLIEGYEYEARVPFVMGHDYGKAAIGDAYLQGHTPPLWGEFALLPEGSTKAADEARA